MTGVSGANSCWCCWVRTMFCLYNAIVAGSHHQLNGYCRWNSWWVFFYFLHHPTGRSQLWISNFPRSKIICKTPSSAYIYFYLRNSFGLIHLAFEVVIQFPLQERIVVVIQHDTWGHLSTCNEAILLEIPGIIWLEKLEKLEIITAMPNGCKSEVR